MAKGLSFSGLFGTADDEGSREKYYSIPACAFIGRAPDADNNDYSIVDVDVIAGTNQLLAPLILPHKAIITNAYVYGVIDPLNTPLILIKAMLFSSPGAGNTIISGGMNTDIVAVPQFADIDNLQYYYTVYIYNLSTNATDTIHGVVVTYTT